jgi:hypothetical protein
MEVIHETPAFLNEVYSFRLRLQNLEVNSISGLKVNVKCKTDATRSQAEDSVNSKLQKTFYFGTKGLTPEEWVPVTDMLECNQTAETTIGMETLNVDVERLLFTVSYQMGTKSPTHGPESPQYEICSCSRAEEIEVATVFPFAVSFSLENLLRNPITSVRTLEPFVLRAETKLLAPNIEIVDQILHLSKDVKIGSSPGTLSSSSFTEAGLLKPEPKGKEFTLFCSAENTTPFSLGHFVVKWKRSQSLFEDQVVESKVFLPDTVSHKSLLFVEANFPKLGITKNPVLLTYTIFNRTLSLLPLEISMGNSDNFMFSGNKTVKLDLGPERSAKQYFMLYPLVCGFVALPKLRIVAYPDTPEAQPMDDLLQDIVPSFMQIMPQGKQSSSSIVPLG